jgi:DNA-binding NarL/FixJ family response regulator
MLQLLRPHLASVYRAVKLRRRLATITANIGADEAKGLTPREREVMLCVGDGSSNAEIARTLVVEPSTVRKHLEHIYAKLGVGNRTAALAKLRA